MSKYLLFLGLFLGLSLSTLAQDRQYIPDTVLINGDTLLMLGDSLLIEEPKKEIFWKTGGNYNLNIQQVTLSNWAAGGSSTFAMNSGLSLYANYKKENKVWDTQLNVNLGFNRQADRDFRTRKTNDNFQFVSNYGRELSEFFYLSTQLDARTQLLPGYKYSKPSGSEQEIRTKISDLLSPGYVQSSTGLNYRKTYKDKSKVSVILSPFTGRFTIVLDDSLSRAGAFGVVPGENVRAEAGMSLAASVAEVQLMKNVTWKSDLNLFSNYEVFGNMVVNFNSIIRMRVNKFISTRIETVIIYDESVFIQQDDGTSKQAIQLQNLINFGISLDF
ncbi:DUF3078 domain-containing protein [Algoriphagus halophytocola]|uniref:DUF3078 domain-containing protein n=1 Tax=Algoriphagus halophytocola TaxID=2991499 RepID=A0ABY6MLG5_9BACT|nr:MULTISPECIES: DUF3078 domain-containing protein [unclassified Algoriphagus]UZD24585.1 DUF3078 domain-containing protein [Algoriphagus sp. TR-M5]WBL41950.1 DUF3078 domain-containing protein [Algoriphagus sp. TR-M9]